MRTRIWFTGFLFGLVYLGSCTSQPEASKTPEVAVAKPVHAISLYDEQDKWPGTCQHASAADQRQSPIALTDALFAKAPKGGIKFSYKPSDVDIVDNGHTIQYRFKGNAGFLEFEGQKYSLKQFHFHKISEHTLNGKAYGMEVHFVHMKESKGKNEKPAAVALGFFVNAGPANADWTKAWAALPAKAAEAAAHPTEESAATPAGHHETILASVPKLNARGLIPAKANYLVYEGSLTTPSCDEIVTHVVSPEPLAFDPIQMEKFASYFSVSNRRIQPLGDAKIRKFRTVREK